MRATIQRTAYTRTAHFDRNNFITSPISIHLFAKIVGIYRHCVRRIEMENVIICKSIENEMDFRVSVKFLWAMCGLYAMACLNYLLHFLIFINRWTKSMCRLNFPQLSRRLQRKAFHKRFSIKSFEPKLIETYTQNGIAAVHSSVRK